MAVELRRRIASKWNDVVDRFRGTEVSHDLREEGSSERFGITLRCPRCSDESSRVESIHGDRNTLEKIGPFRATDRKLTLLHGVRVDPGDYW